MTINNNINNESPPALPPRNNNPFRVINLLKEKLDLKIAFIPSALFYKYQDTNVDHVHVFHQYHDNSTDQQRINNDKIDIDNNNSNKENQLQPTSLKTFKFICQRCHISLFINTSSSEKNGCTGNQYPTHHYHPVLSNSITNSMEIHNKKTDIYSCCGCDKEVHICIKEPTLSLNVFDFLADERPLALDTIPDQTVSLKPTMLSTIITFKTYIKNLMEGEKRNINTRNQNFTAKVGLDFASIQVLEAAGYKLQDELFVAPETINKEQLQVFYEQLILKELEIKSTINQGLDSNLWNNTTATSIILEDILDCQYQVEKTTTVFKPELIPYCLHLGVTNESSTELIIWAFHRMLLEQPENRTELLQTLSHISGITDDELLKTEVAIVISNGSIDNMEIDNIHQQFYNNNNETSNQYSSYFGPAPKKSDNEENQIVLREPTPVGLNNIGNTCYLNSLLQYYFTLVPFRNTILNMDDYVENEDKLGWQSKKIGGIEVDLQEVKRAKTFIKLLRDLFIQLQETHKNAISPEYDLAFMALLNEKENPENEKEKENQFNNNNITDNNIESTPSSTKDGTCSEILGSVSTLVDSKRGSDEERINEQESVEVGNPAEENELPPAYNELATKDEKVLLGGNSDPLIDSKTNLSVINESSTFKNQYNLPTPSTSTSTLDKNESSQQEQPSTSSLSLPKKKKIPDNMMFGKQQDVTECMGNVMYLVEAALKPEETENMEQTRDMVKNLFYGKARQILSYKDTETTDTVQKIKEEEFSHVIVDAAEGKSLYDGLDEYFFAEQVENFRGGKEVIREVTVQQFPPILQILIQRVQFDRTLGNVYKSNAFIQFDEMIYLDRYIDQNFEKLASRRSKVAEWNIQLKECKQVIKDLTKNKDYPMPVSDMLEATANILKEYSNDDENNEEYNKALELLKNEAEQVRNTVDANNEKISDLQSKIKHEYDDLKECAYRLHAVFIHQGQANYGHYWLYIYDHEESIWWKFNDSTVSKVSSTNIFSDTTGSTANPYFLVYVRNDIDNLVQTVFKPTPTPTPTPSETTEDKLSNV